METNRWECDLDCREKTKRSSEVFLAFTLIELLVVIAVIGILASLLLPTLNRAKLAADNTVCRNNLRQYALALQMYVDDFQYYPPEDFSETNNPPCMWHMRLEAYTKTKWVAWVPIAGANGGLPRPRSIQDCPSYGRIPSILYPTGGAYGYSSRGFVPCSGPSLGLSGDGQYAYEAEVHFIRGSEVQCPSDMVAVGDSCLVDVDGVNTLGGIVLSPYVGTDCELGLTATTPIYGPSAAADYGWYKRRHGGRWNFVFCDGHTEHHRTREMFDPRQQLEAMRWNRDHQIHPERISLQYPSLGP
jgi:prepilin-type N-terminal cleavage/methylation domain-containing protein/prepilin-type processing-associated H-X9-DG protein